MPKKYFCDTVAQVKECSSCKERLHFDLFHKKNKGAGGLDHRCKVCAQVSDEQRRRARGVNPMPFCDIENKLKECTKCKTVKPFEEFYRDNGRGGRSSVCSACEAELRKNDPCRPERLRKGHLRRTYGMTVEQYDAMLVAQNGQCAICSKHMDKPHVDHCHATGDVRELLCRNCNHGIGNFKDNTEHLSRAIEYLARHKGKKNA